MNELSALNSATFGFDDDEDLQLIHESIRSFLNDQCDSQKVHAHYDRQIDLADELLSKASELGWLSIGLPESHGGYGFGMTGLIMLHCEIGRFVAPGAFISNSVAGQIFSRFAGDEANDLVSQISTGKKQIAIAATIGGNTINDSVTLLGAEESEFALIDGPNQNISLVCLAGATKQPANYWDRTNSLFYADLKDAEIIATYENAQQSYIRAYALAVSAESAGLMRSIAEKTVAYLMEREQFGRPIGSFQAIKHRAVALYTKIGIAEHVLAQALETEITDSPSATMWALLAKASTTEAATFVAGDCVQLFGGVGFTWEYDVHLYLKRARLNEMLVGANERMKDLAHQQLSTLTKDGKSTMDLATI